MLLCAEKRGRFIPCRGGGTDTTYYTDHHDVDESVMTISMYGDKWATASGVAGLMYRSLYCSSDTTSNGNASRLIYLS